MVKNTLAMIGCGSIGAYHLSHFLQFEDIELVGFCDLIEDRAKAFAEKAGQGRAFTDFRSMYDAVNPAMVFICVPPTCHGDIERETIRRRIPMFVEKPVALDLDLARSIRDEIAAAGLITAVGFQVRYDTLNDVARDFIESSPVTLCDISRIGSVPDAPWWRKKAESGGQIVEQTIHQFDLLRFLLGEPKSVYTLGRRGFVSQQEWPGYDTDDMSITLIEFENGVLCSLLTGCYALADTAWASKMVFGNRRGRIEYEMLHRLRVFGGEPTPDMKADDWQQKKDPGKLAREFATGPDSGLKCDRTFIDAVLTGDGSLVRSSYADAVRTLAFTLSCNESMEKGCPVEVPVE